MRTGIVLLTLALLAAAPVRGQERPLQGAMLHLRSGGGPEWAAFSARPHGDRLELRFTLPQPSGEHLLRLRQQDVKREWRLALNGRRIGVLHQDENDLVGYWPVPEGVLVAGENELRIEPADTVTDDVRVGEIVLEARRPDEALSEAVVEVEVTDGPDGGPIPARIVVVRPDGVLHPVRPEPGRPTAARPGIVYTGTGQARFGLPAGSYTVYAARGFEYGVDSARIALAPGGLARLRLSVRREVPTEGWIAADPHVHTFTHSGHGDATVEERALTIAGEGIELPILTDHNVHVDLGPVAERMGVRARFTPVPGNEVTTRVGHFNVFPVAPGAAPPDHTGADWPSIFSAVEATPGVRAVVLNHARDVHHGFRPFGPDRHVALAGATRTGWALRANAMEVINSGSQQSRPLELLHDWFGALNRGLRLTPVGASDSHDVGRYLVGQARTYVRGRDDDPGRLDVPEAVERFRAGEVMVSFGLLAELTIEGEYGPGALVPAPEESLAVRVRVLGPSWTQADRVTLFANGEPVRTAAIAPAGAGVKWSGTWTLPRPAHDVFLVAVAEGPAPPLPFWPVAKPYQPASLEWHPRLLGASGAAWLDADGDGRATAAHDYAARLLDAHGGDAAELVRRLAAYDEAVAIQAAALLRERGTDPSAPGFTAALAGAAPAVRAGFRRLAEAWEAARAAAGAR